MPSRRALSSRPRRVLGIYGFTPARGVRPFRQDPRTLIQAPQKKKNIFTCDDIDRRADCKLQRNT
jgi:hypothetical protein